MTPNPAFEPTARKRRLQVPSRLRLSVAAQRERYLKKFLNYFSSPIQYRHHPRHQ
jgi:hypothetical protein